MSRAQHPAEVQNLRSPAADWRALKPSRWLAAVDGWVLDGVARDPLQNQRARWLTRVSLLGAAVTFLLAPVFHFSYPSPIVAWINVAQGAMLLACPLLLRRTGSSEIATHWLLANAFVTLSYKTWLLGGIENPVFTWFVVLPFGAALLGGRRCAATWGYTTGLTMVSFVALQIHGWIGDGSLSTSMVANRGVSTAVLALLIAQLGWLQEREIADLVQNLEEERSHFRNAATRDPLTGLLNRSVLKDRLAQVIARSRRQHTLAALYYGDLDDFKAVNDRLGHSFGDALLLEVADRLTSQTRACDSVLRVGGDEFVLIVEDLADHKAAALLAEKLVQLVSAPFEIDGRVLEVGLSVGIALIERGDHTPDQLLDDADAAMYAAKREDSPFRFA